MKDWDELFFARLAIAQARLGRPHPNPRVGAVVVQAGLVVGLGHHEGVGLPHAETVALGEAGARAESATLYVTLEPCNHHGRTPPCVNAIIGAGIRRVVALCPDPNPLVRGGGALALRAAGIDFHWGPARGEVEALLAAWFASLPGSQERLPVHRPGKRAGR